MPVADPQQVGDDTVSGAAFHIVAHHVGTYSVGAVLAGVVLHEKALNGFVFSEDLCHVRTINKLEWNGRNSDQIHLFILQKKPANFRHGYSLYFMGNI